MCKEQSLQLGGCYNNGLTYGIGYYANGELELHSEIFTNLDNGVGGGAITKLRTIKDGITRFIVALKPVEIIDDDFEDEFDEELVVNTFRSMSAISRAKWLNAKEKNSILKPLPCPFCGGKAVEYENCGRYYVECSIDECLVRPSIKTSSASKQQGVKKWNQRKE